MKKVITLLVLILFCSGCSNITYKLEFNKNGSLNEQISLINDVIQNDDSDIGGISPSQAFFSSLDYRTFFRDNELYTKKSFSSLENYLSNSLVFEKFYDSNEIIYEGSKVKIDLKTSDKMFPYLKNNNIGLVEISLYIPYYVSSHNASSVNDNTYTWKIDDLENAHIKINFDMSKSDKYMQNIISIIIISILVVVILFIIIFLYIKNKKNNEI